MKRLFLWIYKYWTRCWKKIAWFSFYIFNIYICFP